MAAGEWSASIHLVFTDVNMPGSMDGIKLAHYIRDRWPPVQLIVASGMTIVEEGHLPAGARFFSKLRRRRDRRSDDALLPRLFGEHADLNL